LVDQIKDDIKIKIFDHLYFLKLNILNSKKPVVIIMLSCNDRWAIMW